MSDVSLEIRIGVTQDWVGALEVWRAANVARGRPPGPQRLVRVRQKLEAADALLVVGLLGDRVIAIALAEPARTDDGHGDLIPSTAHVSMVFVHPDHWSQGVGTALLTALHFHAALRGFPQTSLWTRRTNLPAQRLYAKTGYLPSGLESTLPTGDAILHLHR